MRAYIARRLLLVIPTFFIVTIIVFLMIRLMPGNVIDAILAEGAQAGVSGAEFNREAVMRALGLDIPVHIQYGRWIGGIILRGDLGTSYVTHMPVREELLVRLPVSIEIGIIAIITGLIIALPIGIYSAIRQDTLGDYVARSFAVALIALPSFWLGTLVILFGALWFGWSAQLEYTPFFQDPLANLAQFIVPGAILGMVLSGTTMRMTRTMTLEVLRQDYIRTAWAKGLRESTVIFRHALKNALIPVVTIVGLEMPVLIGGTVILEQLFTLPGVGRLLLQAIVQRDYLIISGVNVFLAFWVLIINLVVDLTYGLLDPRVKYQ